MDALAAVRKAFAANKDKGMGDLETMLSGIWYRLESDGAKLNPTKRPPGYRSERLRKYLRERGARRTSKWGGTAIRGDLEKGKKDHIIDFLRLVNELPGSKESLTRALEVCADLYIEKMNAEYPEIELPRGSPVKQQIDFALRTERSKAEAGKTQQGLVYALLRVRHSKSKDVDVRTKRTHAGDLQSGFNGDIQVLVEGELTEAFEVKGKPIDETEITRVLETHGRHDYPLFILAPDFVPRTKKDELNAMENTFAVDLDDFYWTTFAEICVERKEGTSKLLTELVEAYNEEFCEKIEQDPSIRITVPSS